MIGDSLDSLFGGDSSATSVAAGGEVTAGEVSTTKHILMCF